MQLFILQSIRYQNGNNLLKQNCDPRPILLHACYQIQVVQQYRPRVTILFQKLVSILVMCVQILLNLVSRLLLPSLYLLFLTSKLKSPPEAEYKTAQPVKKNKNKIQITSQFIILHFSKKLLLLDDFICNIFIPIYLVSYKYLQLQELQSLSHCLHVLLLH